MERPLILDRYRPLGEVGRGGFGSVELAWDTRIQRKVAIKRIALPRDRHGRTQIAPLLAEARTAAMLSHPNIVSVYDFDTDDDEAFLIMEYIDGATLTDVLDTEERLTLDEAAALCNALADALTFAHENGVLHLDIKPDNILIDERGRIRIADFGIASLSTAMGHDRTLAGTVGYMPPEQLIGHALDDRTDEWAFASVMLEALAGENPFAASTAQKSLKKIDAPYKTPATTYRSDLPTRADSIFKVALEGDPDERYQFLSQFALEIRDCLGDPEEGRESLAFIVRDLIGDEGEQDEELVYYTLGLWDRLPWNAMQVGARMIGGVAAAVMAWAGLHAFPLLVGQDPWMLWGLVGIAGLLAALAPAIGALVALVALAAGVFAQGSYWMGGLLVATSLVWWKLVSRRRNAEAFLPLIASGLSLFSGGSIVPLLAGFVLRPARAVVASIMGGIVACATLSLVSSRPPTPADWQLYAIMVAGWALAAWVMSVLCSRATRGAAVGGALLGTVVLYAALFGARYAVFSEAPETIVTSQMSLLIGAGCIALLIIASLGAPLRSEGDDDLAYE